METIQAEVVADGQAPLTSAEVVSKVISPDSSNSTFFKNAGLSTRSLKPPWVAEQALLEELAVQKQKEAAITEEFAKVRKRSEGTEEALLKTQQVYDDLKKRQEENNLVLQRILQANIAGISSQPWSCHYLQCLWVLTLTNDHFQASTWLENHESLHFLHASLSNKVPKPHFFLENASCVLELICRLQAHFGPI